MTKFLVVTEKGQITIPKDVRDAFGLKGGDQLVWSVVGNEIVVTPKTIDFQDLAGLLGDPPAGRSSLADIDEAVMQSGGEHVSGQGKIRRNEDAV